MATQIDSARRRCLNLLALCLLSGCGGGEQDFGPTRQPTQQAANKGPSAVGNPAAPTKGADSGPVSVSEKGPADQAASLTSDDSVAKTPNTTKVSQDKASPRPSREDDPPVQVAKTSEKPGANDPPKKETSEKTDPSKAAETDAEPAEGEKVSGTVSEKKRQRKGVRNRLLGTGHKWFLTRMALNESASC